MKIYILYYDKNNGYIYFNINLKLLFKLYKKYKINNNQFGRKLLINTYFIRK